MVCLQTPQRFFELAERRLAVASMRAHLGHEKDLMPSSAFERASEQLFAASLAILPGVIHEGDAAVNRFVHDADGLAHALDRPQMIAAQAQRRDLLPCAPERAARDFALLIFARHDPFRLLLVPACAKLFFAACRP